MKTNLTGFLTLVVSVILMGSCTSLWFNDPPSWVNRTPGFDGQYRYFVGLSDDRVVSEKNARNEAYADAVNQIVKYTGIDVKIIDEYLSEVQGQKSSEVIDPTISSEERIIQRAEALLRTIKDREYYTETFDDPENLNRNLYKVFVLVRIEDNEVSEAIKRIKKFEKERLVRGLIRTTENLENQGKFTAALRESETAETELKIRPLPENEHWLNRIVKIRLRVSDHIENLRKEIHDKDTDLNRLIKEGKVITALNAIKIIKTRIELSGVNDDILNYSKFRVKEQELTSGISLRAETPVEQTFGIRDPPQPLKVKVRFDSNNKSLPLPEFPVLFKAFKAHRTVNSNIQGLATLSLPKPPSIGSLNIVAGPNLEGLSNALSIDALNDLKNKEITFTINISDQMLPLSSASVMLFFKTEGTEEFATGFPVLKPIFVEQITRKLREYNITIISHKVLSGSRPDSTLTQQLTADSANTALVVYLSGRLERKITTMYQGLAYLTVRFEVHRVNDGELSRISALTLDSTVVPIRRWSIEPAATSQIYQQVTQKFTEKYLTPINPIEPTGSKLRELINSLRVD